MEPPTLELGRALFRPCGTRRFRPGSPPLKRWATVVRPGGTTRGYDRCTLTARFVLWLLPLFLAACATGPTGPPTPRKIYTDKPLDRARVERALVAADRSAAGAALGRPAATKAYQNAVEDLVRALDTSCAPRKWKPLDLPGYRLDFAPDRRGLPDWGHWRWDELDLAEDVTVPAKIPPARGPGLGVPLALTVNYSEKLAEKYFALPQNGISLPATALLDFTPAKRGQPRRATLRLINPRETRRTQLAGRQVALAWDAVAPVELQLRDKFVQQLAFLGLFDPGRYARRTGIFALEPYRPDKIPVLFVHGLNSDPHIWQSAVAAVLADEELQRAYQLWYFIYPTGLPVPGSAARLRAQLREAQRRLNPTGRDPGMARTILIGHSMGGLLTRMQVTDSGSDYWKAYFRGRPEDLLLTAQQRQSLKDALFFEDVPWIKRAVFAATPHRGSKLADFGIVRFILFFFRLPLNIAEASTRILTLQPELVNPELWQFKSLGGQSVQTLSPRHPYFRAMDAQPIRVPFHSIIGDRGRGDTPQSSDGVVPYSSSHVEGARSEVIVPAPHGLTDHPQTVAEILRILREHLRASGGRIARAPATPTKVPRSIRARPPAGEPLRR